MDIWSRIASVGVLPVIVIEKADHAAPLAEALLAGGLPAAEVTFRTDAAAQAIAHMASYQDLLLGAGTVLHAEQAQQATDAGAQFLISPGTNPATIQFCHDHQMTIIPGVCTPSDCEQALSLGISTVKFFPAGAYGGLKTLKAIAAPYGMLRFIPTGGINGSNIGTYLAFDKVLACGGSWMVPAQLIREEKWSAIEQLAAEAVAIVAAARAG